MESVNERVGVNEWDGERGSVFRDREGDSDGDGECMRLGIKSTGRETKRERGRQNQQNSWMVSEIVRLLILYLDPCCKWITSKI